MDIKLTLNRFISYSLIIHLFAMSLLFISPVKREQRGTQFFARLVTPEDIGLDNRELASPQSLPAPESERLAPSITKEAPRTYSSEQSVPSTLQKGSEGSSQNSQIGGDSSSILSDTGIIPPGIGSSFGKRVDLLDKEVVERIARKEPEAQKEKSTVTFDAKELKYYGYMERLKEKIEGIWKYPQDAAMKGIYGDLYISFTIKKNGSLGSVELMRTSGHRSLDEAAIKALNDAAPYWPLPEDWGKEGFTITGHFIYTLYGTYIR